MLQPKSNEERLIKTLIEICEIAENEDMTYPGKVGSMAGLAASRLALLAGITVYEERQNARISRFLAEMNKRLGDTGLTRSGTQRPQAQEV